MRHGDTELKRHVDRALSELQNKGLVEAALKRYHTPYFPPFEGKQPAQQSSSRTTPPRQSPVDRGLEPQMERRQRSRHPYGGLERIRSRGTLIVGLDQNNLPFSTAHPEPAGLDYEIAEQLAAELGVSLRVYWAYSSHDSYPSKLARKELCDVMLGVMPDDRFEQQVMYSHPYFHVSYQYALAAGRTDLSEIQELQNATIAMEPGVAVRSLDDVNIRSMASMEAIFAALVAGEVQAGYVISSRGQWLANRKWPGQIQFVAPPASVDRFPICAAVRRTESDLKAAIDAALVKLDQSGEMEQIFARWNVPYDRSDGQERPPQ
jgi:ABC-type amino acid transport substrate-binding protein